jgi:site-specific recombinase XerD
MNKRPPRTPSYCLHKASGQAVVRIDGRDYYLGKYGTDESRAEYDRLVAEWLGNGRALAAPTTADGLTVAELILAYWQWAERYYRNERGEPSLDLENIRTALKPLRRLYGHTAAAAFGPLALRAIQEDLAKSGLSRGVVNARVNRIRRAFKWAVSYQLIPASVHEALRTVPGLQRGRCEAREAPSVQPVLDEHVNATLPFLPAPVRAMVELQRVSGCRPGEVMAMRAIDLSMAGAVWTYRPASHKNKHRGLDRVIFLGRKAQVVIKPFVTTNVDAFLFSPRAYVEELHRRRAEQRKTKRTPSQLARKRKVRPKRQPAERYNRRSYRVAIVRASDKANAKALKELGGELAAAGKTPAEIKQELEGKRLVPRWSPLQLRHTAATELRARFGIEAAKVILGHTKVETTQIYAERDLEKAQEIMREIG